MRGPLADDENPYRFTGGAAAESRATPHVRRQMTLRNLHAIARRRRLLTLFLAIFVGSLALACFAILRVPAAQVTTYDELILYKNLSFTAGLGFWFGLIGGFFVGSRLVTLSDRSFGWLMIMGLIAPGLNVVIAIRLLGDAKRTLESRNVRVGWLTCDFSQADVDRSFWRPSSL